MRAKHIVPVSIFFATGLLSGCTAIGDFLFGNPPGAGQTTAAASRSGSGSGFDASNLPGLADDAPAESEETLEVATPPPTAITLSPADAPPPQQPMETRITLTDPSPSLPVSSSDTSRNASPEQISLTVSTGTASTSDSRTGGKPDHVAGKTDHHGSDDSDDSEVTETAQDTSDDEGGSNDTGGRPNQPMSGRPDHLIQPGVGGFLR